MMHYRTNSLYRIAQVACEGQDACCKHAMLFFCSEPAVNRMHQACAQVGKVTSKYLAHGLRLILSELCLLQLALCCLQPHPDAVGAAGLLLLRLLYDACINEEPLPSSQHAADYSIHSWCCNELQHLPNNMDVAA